MDPKSHLSIKRHTPTPKCDNKKCSSPESNSIIPEDRIVSFLDNITELKSSMMYFNPMIFEKRQLEQSCSTCQRTCAECSGRISVVGIGLTKKPLHLYNQIDVANQDLKKEVKILKKTNETLLNEISQLKICLNNSKQQVSYIINDYQRLERLMDKYQLENSILAQKLAFSEQKLDQYVSAVFKHQNKIQDLKNDIALTINKYEAQLNNLRIKRLEKPQTSAKLNYSLNSPNKQVKTFILARKPKSVISDLDKHKIKIRNLNSFYVEAMICLHHLFRDRGSDETWKRAQCLFNQYSNSFVLDNAATTNIIEA